MNLNQAFLLEFPQGARDGLSRCARKIRQLFMSQGHREPHIGTIASRCSAAPVQQNASQPARCRS